MKRSTLFCCLLAGVLLLLNGCAAPLRVPAASSACPLTERVEEALGGYEGMTLVDIFDLAELTGLDETMVEEGVYLVSADGLSPEEVVALRCTDEKLLPAVKDRLEVYLGQRLRETQHYLPDVYTLLTEAEIRTKGRLVLLVTGRWADAWAETILAGEP